MACPLGYSSSAVEADLPDVIDLRTGEGVRPSGGSCSSSGGSGPCTRGLDIVPLTQALRQAQWRESAVTAGVVQSFIVAVKGEGLDKLPRRLVMGFFQDLVRVTLKAGLQLGALTLLPEAMSRALLRSVSAAALDIARSAPGNNAFVAAMMVPVAGPALVLSHVAVWGATQSFAYAQYAVAVWRKTAALRSNVTQERAPSAGFSTITRTNTEITAYNNAVKAEIAEIEAGYLARRTLNALASLTAIVAGTLGAATGSLFKPGTGTAAGAFVGETVPYFVI